MFRYSNTGGANAEQKIHPTQKPVKLYEFLLDKFAKTGQRILSTHMGSGSDAIACHNLGFDGVFCEIDKNYYDAACARLKAHQAQQTLFSPKEQKYEQTDAFAGLP